MSTQSKSARRAKASSAASLADRPPDADTPATSTHGAPPALAMTTLTPSELQLARAPQDVVITAVATRRSAKSDRQAIYMAVIHGLRLYYKPESTFELPSGTYTRDALIAKFQAFIGRAQLTKASYQKWRADVQAEHAAEEEVSGLRTDVRRIAHARFGPNGAPNLQFGFALPRPTGRSAATMAIAVEKARATRKKRGTMGHVQKKAIKGDVHVDLVVTPIDDRAPLAPAPAAQTAPDAADHPVTSGRPE